MNKILTGLGVLPEVQALFNIAEPVFDYGDAKERFGHDFHYVPATNNLWLAGLPSASEVIITSSAIEVIAYCTINYTRLPGLNNLCFMALGNLPNGAQLSWIRANYPKRKFTLVFSNDLIGRATDLVVALGIKRKIVRLIWTGDGVKIVLGSRSFVLGEDELSLNAFELTFGIRTGIRTRKPIDFLTFLDQLKYDNNRRY